MSAVEAVPGLPLTAYAARLGVSKQTVAQHAAKLEADGLIDRRPGPRNSLTLYKRARRGSPPAWHNCPTVGSRLAGLRQSKGLTQDALAQRANVHPITLSRIESDATGEPALATLLALLEAAGASRTDATVVLLGPA